MSQATMTGAESLRVRKRTGKVVDFAMQKIVQAVRLCLVNGCMRDDNDETTALATRVAARIQQTLARNPGTTVTVEQIQDLAELSLMAFGECEAAKQYILYRDERRRLRDEQEAKQVSIFKRRDAFKPFEYPDVVPFKKAIQHAPWNVDEFNFISDVHEFHVKLQPHEKTAITRALLAIAQIEVSVKRFWANIGLRFPKAEIEQVGMTFAESEVRHADAYSQLLNVLGLDGLFDGVLKVPAIRARVDYLQTALAGSNKAEDDEYAMILSLFSLFVENVSLFSQFAVIKSFNRHRKMLKDVDNVVQATQKEEQLHALFGALLVNKIREEKPEWFNLDFYDRLNQMARMAFEAESKIVDWMFAEGELDFLPKATLIEFIKHRMNESIAMIGGSGPFVVDEALLAGMRWFTDELHADVRADFFHKRPVTYTQGEKAFNADELF